MRELSKEEITNVTGAHPAVWAARCALSSKCRTAVKVVALAVAGGVSAGVGYVVNR